MSNGNPSICGDSRAACDWVALLGSLGNPAYVAAGAASRGRSVNCAAGENARAHQRDVGAEARLLIEAKETCDAAADGADGAPDNRAHWSSGSIALVSLVALMFATQL
jgi:hypothetical protein